VRIFKSSLLRFIQLTSQSWLCPGLCKSSSAAKASSSSLLESLDDDEDDDDDDDEGDDDEDDYFNEDDDDVMMTMMMLKCQNQGPKQHSRLACQYHFAPHLQNSTGVVE